MKLNKKAVAGVGLGALALVGGTFAYYNQTTSLDNPLSTPKYEDALVEEFTPPTDNLQPGQNWNKDVWAVNTGDAPLVVRIRMEEAWTRKNGSEYKKLTSVDNYDKFIGSTGTYNATTGIYEATQDTATDGYVEGKDDESVVYKLLVNNDGSANKWIDGGDGYWYWNGVLEAGAKTVPLMDELILAKNMDIGVYEATEYYARAAAEPAANDSKWTKVNDVSEVVEAAKKLKEDKEKDPNITDKIFRRDVSLVKKDADDVELLGYSNSNYVLTIYSEFVQATDDAVRAQWGDANFEKLTNVQASEDGRLTAITKAE